jgi:hypothetical protein
MPEELSGMPPCPSRRAALGLGVGALAALTLGACGIRLEDDAPHVPLIPTRSPIAGESFLVSLWRECGTLAEAAAALGGAPKALPSVLAGLHHDQSQVLREELRRLTVPDKVLDEPSPTTTSPPTTGPHTTGPSQAATTSGPTSTTGPQSLAALEGAAVGGAAFHSLAGAVTPAVPLYGAALAQRAAVATLLGGTVAWADPAWDSPSLAASFLESTRAATYGFQVATAQSPKGAQRTLATSTLAALQARALTQESLAGDAAGPPPLAYPLPFTVTTPAAARRLAVHLLTELRSSVARELASAGASDGPLGSLVQWLAETEVLASRWGIALEPFPGLVAPGQ